MRLKIYFLPDEMYNGRAALSCSMNLFPTEKLFHRDHKTCNFFNAIFHKKDLLEEREKNSGEIVLYPVNIDENCS